MFEPRIESDSFGKTADIVVAGDGTWSYAVAEGDMPVPGLYWVVAELKKSGTKETTLNRVELHIRGGASS